MLAQHVVGRSRRPIASPNSRSTTKRHRSGHVQCSAVTSIAERTPRVPHVDGVSGSGAIGARYWPLSAFQRILVGRAALDGTNTTCLQDSARGLCASKRSIEGRAVLAPRIGKLKLRYHPCVNRRGTWTRSVTRTIFVARAADRDAFERRASTDARCEAARRSSARRALGSRASRRRSCSVRAEPWVAQRNGGSRCKPMLRPWV